MSIEPTETPYGADQPVPWIVQYQRGQCSGASALTTFQGLLCDEIVLPQSAADHSDPEQLVLATDAWVDALIDQAHFLPGEFAQEALWSYYVRDYFVQARLGGHAQYYANRGADEIALHCAGAGLKSMLADPHLELFNLLVRLKRSKPSRARRIATEKGYRSIAAALKGLDKRFADLEINEPLTPRHKVWLKSLRKVKLAPDAEMTAHLQRAAQANPLFSRRRQEADRLRVERVHSEPAFRAVKALCDMAGLQLLGMRSMGFAPIHSIWPDGPDVRAYAFRADTDKGPRTALFYGEGGLFKRYRSVLIEQGANPPLGSLSLGKAEFASIVPTGR
jgi:hypothetical protein